MCIRNFAHSEKVFFFNKNYKTKEKKNTIKNKKKIYLFYNILLQNLQKNKLNCVININNVFNNIEQMFYHQAKFHLAHSDKIIKNNNYSKFYINILGKNTIVFFPAPLPLPPVFKTMRELMARRVITIRNILVQGPQLQSPNRVPDLVNEGLMSVIIQRSNIHGSPTRVLSGPIYISDRIVYHNLVAVAINVIGAHHFRHRYRSFGEAFLQDNFINGRLREELIVIGNRTHTGTRQVIINNPQLNQAQPNQAQPNQAQPNQGQPNQAQPNQGQPNQGQPNQAQPGQVQNTQPTTITINTPVFSRNFTLYDWETDTFTENFDSTQELTIEALPDMTNRNTYIRFMTKNNFYRESFSLPTYNEMARVHLEMFAKENPYLARKKHAHDQSLEEKIRPLIDITNPSFMDEMYTFRAILLYWENQYWFEHDAATATNPNKQDLFWRNKYIKKIREAFEKSLPNLEVIHNLAIEAAIESKKSNTDKTKRKIYYPLTDIKDKSILLQQQNLIEFKVEDTKANREELQRHLRLFSFNRAVKNYDLYLSNIAGIHMDLLITRAQRLIQEKFFCAQDSTFLTMRRQLAAFEPFTNLFRDDIDYYIATLLQNPTNFRINIPIYQSLLSHKFNNEVVITDDPITTWPNMPPKKLKSRNVRRTISQIDNDINIWRAQMLTMDEHVDTQINLINTIIRDQFNNTDTRDLPIDVHLEINNLIQLLVNQERMDNSMLDYILPNTPSEIHHLIIEEFYRPRIPIINIPQGDPITPTENTTPTNTTTTPTNTTDPTNTTTTPNQTITTAPAAPAPAAPAPAAPVLVISRQKGKEKAQKNPQNDPNEQIKKPFNDGNGPGGSGSGSGSGSGRGSGRGSGSGSTTGGSSTEISF